MLQVAPKSQGLLAPLHSWLSDKEVSEIVLNKPQEIFVEKKGVFARYEVPAYDENKLAMLFQLIANENHQTLTSQRPLLSGNLLDGTRIQLVIPPAAKHYTFAIRRQVVRDLTLEELKILHFYRHAQSFKLQEEGTSYISPNDKILLAYYQQQNWDSFIQAAICYRKNILITGGTSSSKTTFLNACLRQIPQGERLITLEDTREIEISHPNQVNLVATKGVQGMAAVTMQDLLQCSLRLRPDRIIMGEIRGKEILDFVAACATGHEGSLSTLHANNPRIAFMRMTQMYKQNNVPAMTDREILKELMSVIDVIVQVGRNKGGRCVESIYYKHAQDTKLECDMA